MKVAVGCDPNAMELKNILRDLVGSLGHEAVDYGSEDPIYANTAFRVAEDVAKGVCDRGILVCGTGIGMSIAANKVKGAYAACINDVYQAQRSCLSNNANIITLGSQVTGPELAKCLVQAYLELTYDPNSRSAPKVERIEKYEQGEGL
ncbi:MAG: RpiB/LacA/LacB family sugar-phosphate isomerase [Oscillospiraceae bacterium]|jgi:ribose 5-phosphate isomerase B|nr:RpiB/LacA/LacB family sugar-phosphate isomerase [Oscillospiraceae bacterium]